MVDASTSVALNQTACSLLSLQRSLATSLAFAGDEAQALRAGLEASLVASGAEYGVACLLNGRGDLTISCFHGMSAAEAESLRLLNVESPWLCAARSGKPLYGPCDMFCPFPPAFAEDRRLSSVAVVPVKNRDVPVAVFCLASTEAYAFAGMVGDSIELTGASVGSALARVSAERSALARVVAMPDSTLEAELQQALDYRHVHERWLESERRFSLVTQSTTDVVFECDGDSGTIVWYGDVDGALGYLPGQAPRTLSGVMGILHPDDAVVWRAQDLDLYTTPLADREVRIRRADGEYAHWRIEVRKLDGDGTQRVRAIGAAHDVTDSKKAEVTLRRTVARLEATLEQTIDAMAVTVEQRDGYTAAHQRRVADLAVAIGGQVGLSSQQLCGLRLASGIHDIGKLFIPAEYLSKPGSLTSVELAIMKSHAVLGYEVLRKVDFPWPIAQAVLQHHERLDGSGYPNGLTGSDAIIEARVIGVADVVEAMSSHRPYRPALGVPAALSEIETNKGILYDPQVVDACLELFSSHNYSFVV